MKNLNRALIIVSLVVAVTLSTGCVAREITVNPYADDPKLAIGIKADHIDWNQVMESCQDIMFEEDLYPYVDYIDFAVNEEKGYVDLILPLTNDAPRECAKDYAKAYIRAFNDSVAVQDYEVEVSSPDYYGSFWDEWNMQLEVFLTGDILTTEKYIIAQVIPAGSNDEIHYYDPATDDTDFYTDHEVENQ